MIYSFVKAKVVKMNGLALKEMDEVANFAAMHPSEMLVGDDDELKITEDIVIPTELVLAANAWLHAKKGEVV